MDATCEHLQRHCCRTCLTQLAENAGVAARNVEFWMLPSLSTDETSRRRNKQLLHMPQKLCHECHQALRLANEFRAKVRAAEQQLLSLNGQEQRGARPRRICCRICQRQYLAEVKSLTCLVRDAPHLREWLVWSSSGGHVQKQSHSLDAWSAHTVCRFCYAHLRDCYEWHLAAKESAEYLRKLIADTSTSADGGYEFEDAKTKQAFLDTINAINDEEPLLLEPIVKLEYGEHSLYDASEQFYDDSDSAAPVPHQQHNFINFMEDMEALPTPTPPAVAITTRRRNTAYDDGDAADWTLPPLSSSTRRTYHQQPSTRNIMPKSKVQQSHSFASICHQCQQRFNKPQLLEAHVLHVHQGKSKPFLCKYCTHAYITHSHLKRHLKTAHIDRL